MKSSWIVLLKVKSCLKIQRLTENTDSLELPTETNTMAAQQLVGVPNLGKNVVPEAVDEVEIVEIPSTQTGEKISEEKVAELTQEELATIDIIKQDFDRQAVIFF